MFHVGLSLLIHAELSTKYSRASSRRSFKSMVRAFLPNWYIQTKHEARFRTCLLASSREATSYDITEFDERHRQHMYLNSFTTLTSSIYICPTFFPPSSCFCRFKHEQHRLTTYIHCSHTNLSVGSLRTTTSLARGRTILIR